MQTLLPSQKWPNCVFSRKRCAMFWNLWKNNFPIYVLFIFWEMFDFVHFNWATRKALYELFLVKYSSFFLLRIFKQKRVPRNNLTLEIHEKKTLQKYRYSKNTGKSYRSQPNLDCNYTFLIDFWLPIDFSDCTFHQTEFGSVQPNQSKKTSIFKCSQNLV